MLTCISGSVLCIEEFGRRLQGLAVPHANSSEGVMSSVDTPTALPTCIRHHTSAYVSICQHTSAYVSICQHTSAYVSIRQHASAYVSIRQHTSAYVSICQHTSAYVSRRQQTSAYACSSLLTGRRLQRLESVRACTVVLVKLVNQLVNQVVN